jgi:hypothetical protein
LFLKKKIWVRSLRGFLVKKFQPTEKISLNCNTLLFFLKGDSSINCKKKKMARKA